MSATVYLRTSAPDPGSDIYDTIAGAIAALDPGDCTDAGDPGTIVPLDSGMYIGQAAFGARQYVDIRAVPGSGCAPIIQHNSSGVVTTADGATRLRIIGDPGARMLLRLNPLSGAGSDVIQPAPGCSVEVQDCDYEAPTGTANQLIQCAGSGESYTFRRCDCLQGSFASPVQNGWAAAIELIDCDWLAMTDQTGPVVTTNTAVVSVVRCKLRGATLLGSFSPFGTPAGRHTIANNILIHNPGVTQFDGMISLGPGRGHSVGADIFCNAIIGDGTAGWSGVYSEYTTQDIRNNIVVGFAAYGWDSDGAVWSPTYSLTYDCGTVYGGGTYAGAGMLTGDPLLDGDYRPAGGSPCIGGGTTTGLTTDIEGNVRPYLVEDIGPYERWPGFYVTGAVFIPPDRVDVAFSEDPDETTIGAAGDWTLFDPLGALALPNITAVAMLPGDHGIGLTVDGEVPDDAWVRAPATLEDVTARVIDVDGRESVILIGDEQPLSMTLETQGDALHVDVAGQAIDDPPWSPLPTDPWDVDELLDRAIVTCLGTDARALPDDVLPTNAGPVPYRGGSWSDPLCPTRNGTRIWLLRGADPTAANAERGAQIYEKDLQWLIDDGWASSVSATGAATGSMLEWTISVVLRGGNELTYTRRA